MDVDHDPQGQTSPLGTPFDEAYTTTTNKGASSANPPEEILTANFYTPLYTEFQETYHTNVNNNQRTSQPIRTHLETIRDAEVAHASAVTRRR